MKLLAIFRFEVAYQLRRPWTWHCFATLVVFALVNTRVAIVPVTLPQDFILNSPFIITSVTVFSCQVWLLIAPAVAGEAAARDVHTGQYPLTYTSPVGRTEYLGGRVLAALAVHALILLGVQVGSLLAAHGPGADPAIIGPFRPAAYLAAYGLVALPNAFIATAFQFTAALLSGRPMASYAGSLALFFLSYPVTMALYLSGLGKRALMADPIGVLAIMNEMMSNWTIAEKNVRAFTLDGAMLANRLLWIGIASLVLAVVHLRFRFAHRAATDPLSRVLRWLAGGTPARDVAPARVAIAIPRVDRSFGLAVQLRQALAIARSSFRAIATSPPGLFLLLVFPLFVVLVLVMESEQWGVPLVPRTGYIVSKQLSAPLTEVSDFRVIVPLLIVYFAAELVWRERDARISENVDTAPVPEWVLHVGKYLGLALVLVALMASLTAAGVASQAIRGHHEFELGLYARLLFGFQLVEYLLFAALAFLVHALVDQKYLSMLIAFVLYMCIALASLLGIEHRLLVYGSSPAWTYTDMLGHAGSVGPWLWFKLYWAAWALLLGVATALLWVRGREGSARARLRAARLRFGRGKRGVVAFASLLVLGTGGFVFYNTNVLNEYVTDDEMVRRRADYERRYGRYEGIPQPQRAATALRVEIHPRRGTATIRGSHRLVNRDTVPIDSIHLEPALGIETRMTLDRPARAVVADGKLGHFIYALDEPLQPGDSLTLDFDVRLGRRGFRNAGPRSTGAGAAVVANGTHFTSGVLPIVGYQPMRELWSADDRRRHGLPRQVTLAAPADIDARVTAIPAATFAALIATDAGQVAVAPGELRRTWNERSPDGEERRWFHYESDVPLNGTEVFFSADYTVHRERYRGVDVQVYVHPAHGKHLERVLRGVRASLDWYSAQFGAYPLRFLQVVEQPGNFLGMGVDGSGVITGGEGFFLLDPKGDGLDAMFEVVAHEMGHLWWGMQLKPAIAEGGGVISEGLAWYSAMQLVKHEKGREALRRFMSIMRQPNPWPPIRTGLPLLRAMDPWANYRKAPYAMHALSEYAGEERVNGALRRLLERKRSSLATTLDLYRELQAATPDSLQPLLHDLFEVNAFWTFDTKSATAVPVEGGAWRVTLEVEAHKSVADSTGPEREVPMGEWVEIGIFAPRREGEQLGAPLYVRKHRVRSGTQAITVTVPGRPARAGIDPYNLLDWEEGDNIEPVDIPEGSR